MNYGFFDYKYNIFDLNGNPYSGQDFDSPYRIGYMIFALVTALILAFIFRKSKKEHMTLYLKIISIVMIVLEVSKVSWETYWDISTGRGANFGGIMSLETCSLFMYTAVVAGFTKNEKIRRCCASWLETLGLVAGLSNVFVPNGLKWYPFWTFGAFHSLIYHYVMVLTALLLVFNRYVDLKFKDIFSALIPHAIFSALVIPVDYIFKWNYMLYRDPSAFPIINLLTDKLTDMGLYPINTLIVMVMFVFFTALFISIYIGVYALIDKIKYRKMKQINPL